MRNKGVLEINNLNQEFYNKHKESFSKSRDSNFWKGFFHILKYINAEASILDLGCGNGRFLQFLLESQVKFQSYLGVDSLPEFIAENLEKYNQGNFHTQDIIEYENFQALGTKSHVFVFGVTHHIPSKEFRKKWFQSLEVLVKEKGILVLSFWKFDTKKAHKFIPKHYIVENNDYFLGWKGDFSKLRYCHFYDYNEITEVKQVLKNFKILSEFEADSNQKKFRQKN